MMFSKCDEEMENKGIPCDCPIPTGLFSVPSQTITVTKEQIDKLPSALNWFVEVSSCKETYHGEKLWTLGGGA
jgi:hypothetical protein